jgi:hypothetical protein
VAGFALRHSKSRSWLQRAARGEAVSLRESEAEALTETETVTLTVTLTERETGTVCETVTKSEAGAVCEAESAPATRLINKLNAISHAFVNSNYGVPT